MPSSISSRIFRAGAARCAVTPPVGVELSGWAFGPSCGVHDPLHARALFLDDGATSLVLATVEACGVDRAFCDAVKNRVREDSGIPPEHLLIAATHTHSGPAVAYLRHWGERDETYIAGLQDRLVETILTARENAVPARLGCGQAEMAGEVVNRREPDGPIDPAALALRVDTPDGQPLAVGVNFACHPVCMHGYRRLFSADYPGVLARRLRERWGDEVVVLFLPGAGGDINPRRIAVGTGCPEENERLGCVLAERVAASLEGASFSTEVALGAATAEARLPLEPLPAPAELARQAAAWHGKLAELTAADGPWPEIARARTMLQWSEEMQEAQAHGAVPEQLSAPVQAFRVHDAAFLATGAEMFHAVGLAMKAASPAAFTFVVGYANDYQSYVAQPPQMRLRGYETGTGPMWIGRPLFAENVAEPLQETAEKLLRQLWG